LAASPRRVSDRAWSWLRASYSGRRGWQIGSRPVPLALDEGINVPPGLRSTLRLHFEHGPFSLHYAADPESNAAPLGGRARPHPWSFAMGSRCYWIGFLKLSLVCCAVALYPVASRSERISFHWLNRETGNRLRQLMVDSDTNEPVEGEDRVRGF